LQLTDPESARAFGRAFRQFVFPVSVAAPRPQHQIVGDCCLALPSIAAGGAKAASAKFAADRRISCRVGCSFINLILLNSSYIKRSFINRRCSSVRRRVPDRRPRYFRQTAAAGRDRKRDEQCDREEGSFFKRA
jgi:hypothetical protein